MMSALTVRDGSAEIKNKDGTLFASREPISCAHDLQCDTRLVCSATRPGSYHPRTGEQCRGH